MKKFSFLIFVCLMSCQAFFPYSGELCAETTSSDTLSWTWVVSSLASTHTKTCTLAFAGGMIVDWGDGSREKIPDSLSTKGITHVYLSDSTYFCSAIGNGVTYFKADSKRVSSIDTHAAPQMNYLNCNNCQLTSLDLTRNPELVSLYCGGNGLASLNLAHNIKLQTLTCSENQLSSLDISMLPALKKVIAHTNPLTEVKICSTGTLNYLSCLNCGLNAVALNAILDSLPLLTSVPTGKNLYISNNPGSGTCHVGVASAKNWMADVSATKSSIYIPSVISPAADSVQFDICMKNPVPVMAFEIDLVLPDGLELDTLRSCLACARKGGHTLSIVRTSDSTMQYKLLSFSMKNKEVYAGDSGSVLQLFMKVSSDEKTYSIHINNAILIDTATNVMDISVSDGTLTLKSATIKGDANGDDRVDVTDVVGLVAYINGRRPDRFDPTAADIDGNGVWNIADITKMVVIINESGIESQNLSQCESRSVITESLSLYDAATAPSGNHLYIRQSGDDLTCLELCLDNADTIQAYQVDVILPEGVGLSTGNYSQKSGRTGNHIFMLSKISSKENGYRILSYALRPEASIQGDTGAIARLSLTLGKDIKPGEYSVIMRQPVLAGLNTYAVDGSAYDARFKVSAPSEKSGSISIGSSSLQGLWVRGKSLREVSVFDLSGKLCFERDMQGACYAGASLPSGIYMVKVCSDCCPPCARKVVVK